MSQSCAHNSKLLVSIENYLEGNMKISRISTGLVAQSVGHLTRKSEVLGSIPGLAAYFRFSFH